MPSAMPRFFENHMDTARLQVTGVEPMPISPSAAASAIAPSSSPSGRGGVQTTRLVTPAARAQVEQARVLVSGLAPVPPHGSQNVSGTWTPSALGPSAAGHRMAP